MIFSRIIFLVIGIFSVQFAAAQQDRIDVSVNKKKILIGESIELTILVELNPASGLKLPVIDTIPHFEMLQEPIVDSSNGGRISFVYYITSFDSGRWSIPSYALSKSIQSDSIPIDVVFSEFDPNQEYHDIKDILEVEVKKKQFPWWWYAGGAVLLIALVTWLVKRKPAAPATLAPKLSINAYDEAIKDLEQLERSKPAAKIYYSKLTDIFRLYIYRKKGILSLQKTTDDLVLQLRDLNLGKEQFDKLSQSLRLSDFVKFAKYVPGEEDDRTAFRDILQAINTIEQAEIK